jgi:hypothetical protein
LESSKDCPVIPPNPPVPAVPNTTCPESAVSENKLAPARCNPVGARKSPKVTWNNLSVWPLLNNPEMIPVVSVVRPTSVPVLKPSCTSELLLEAAANPVSYR